MYVIKKYMFVHKHTHNAPCLVTYCSYVSPPRLEIHVYNHDVDCKCLCPLIAAYGEKCLKKKKKNVPRHLCHICHSLFNIIKQTILPFPSLQGTFSLAGIKIKKNLLFLHTRSIPLFVSDNHIYSGWLNST